MNAVHDLKKQAQQAADDTRRHLMESRAEKKLQLAQEQTLAALREQTAELQLRKTLGKRQKSGGGMPWGLILLVGAGYALYRTNPGVRDQIQGLLKRVDPGAGGNLSRAGDAVKGAVDDLGQGRDPSDNFGRVAGEVQRAGEKAVDGAKDKLGEAGDRAREAAADVKKDANRGMA